MPKSKKRKLVDSIIFAGLLVNAAVIALILIFFVF
jgi:hypothetical protein